MATIRLASAIGEQRKPIDVLGGIDEAISKTGDAIIKGINDRNERDRKKAEQDQKLKDLLASNTKITPPERAVPEQAAEYENFAKEGDFQIRKAALDPKTTPMQLEKMQQDFLYALKDRKNKYEKDYDTIHGVSELAINKGTHDDVLFQNFLIGKENPTKVAEMANDDFMAASEADRAGKMVGENGMQATETKTNYNGQNYFKLPFEEQKKIDLAEKANRLVTQRVPGIEPAAKAYLGKDLDFKNYTEKLDDVDPKTGKFVYTFKEEDVNRDADRFASSMVGEGNFGSKDHYLQQKAYETAAIKAAVDAGVPQEKMPEAVKEFVQVVAKEDFKRAAQTAYENRIKDQKEIEKNPKGGKGFENNVNIGGGGENALWKFGKPVKTNIREGATFKRVKDKEGNETKVPVKKGDLKEYEYISMQTKTPASNPAMVINGESVYYQGVVKEVGGDKVVKFKFNTKADDGGEDRFIPVGKLNPSTISDIKTNVGENDFEKAAAIGDYAPKKAETKGTAPKAKKVTKEEVKNKLAGF